MSTALPTIDPSGSTLYKADRVVTCDEARATASDPLGVIEEGAVLVAAGEIVAVGSASEMSKKSPSARTVHVGPLLTPGLCDAHTHSAFSGSRHDEYVRRLAGEGYEAIAAAGGGIVSSMRAVRAATHASLAMELARRLERMAALGVTTVEVKSGYGLDLESERKQLEAIAEVARDERLPRVLATYLALHALPPEAAGDRDAYARRVATESIDAVVAAKLASFVDAYVDRSAFSVEQARPALARARAAGLGVRIHVGQFADIGGAELAAELGALSADHLEHVSAEGADRLAASGVRAVLLPVASFVLGQAPPPIALLRSAGVRLVVASDANPGTAPTESLPLAMAFAARTYGLSLAETVLGATREAARSLGRVDVGQLAPGSCADLVAWDLPHEAALLQPHGTSRTRAVVRDGRIISGSF